MRIALLLALGSAALAVPARVGAQGNDEYTSSAECCINILSPRGARLGALGGALTARALADAVAVNPAAVATLTADEFRAHSERTDQANSTSIATSFGVGGVGTVSISYWLLDSGDIPARDDFGNDTGIMRFTNQAFAATFATHFLRQVSAGVTYRLFVQRDDCRGFCNNMSSAGSNSLIDVGARASVPWIPSLEVGAAIINSGLPLQIKNKDQSDPPPTRIRVGVAYDLLQLTRADSIFELIASADVSRGVRAGIEPGIGAGLELVMDRSLFLRGGYATGTGQGSGASLGVGVIWDRFDVSVAKSFVDYRISTEPFQITFAIRF